MTEKRKFQKGELLLSILPNLRNRQMFYLVTRAENQKGFVQVRHATRGGKFDRRHGAWSFSGLAKNYVAADKQPNGGAASAEEK